MVQTLNETDIEHPMELEKLLHYRVQRLASKMTLITTREVLAGSGVHIGEWRLLCLLKENGQINHTTVSQKLGLDPGRTSKLLKAAERKEFVRRTGDPRDGRASIFELTDKGVGVIGQLWPLANSLANDFHNQFDIRELEQLSSMLDRAVAYANKRLQSD